MEVNVSVTEERVKELRESARERKVKHVSFTDDMTLEEGKGGGRITRKTDEGIWKCVCVRGRKDTEGSCGQDLLV